MSMLNRVAIWAEPFKVFKCIVSNILILVVGVKNFWIVLVSTPLAFACPARSNKDLPNFRIPASFFVSASRRTVLESTRIHFIGNAWFFANCAVNYYGLFFEETHLATIRAKFSCSSGGTVTLENNATLLATVCRYMRYFFRDHSVCHIPNAATPAGAEA